MGCEERWYEVHQLEAGMEALERAGMGPGTPSYELLNKQYQASVVIAQRTTARTMVATSEPTIDVYMGQWSFSGTMESLGLSSISASPEITLDQLREATIRVWFNTEQAWKAEVKVHPGADPILTMITAEEAVSILQNRPSPELLGKLLHIDEYQGE